MLSEIQDRSRSGTEPCCPANCETAGETAAVATCRSHGRSVTCRDFWRFRCRFPTVDCDRPLAIVRLSQQGSVPPSGPWHVEIRRITPERLVAVREENPRSRPCGRQTEKRPGGAEI